MKTYLVFGFLILLGTSCQSEQRQASDAVAPEMAPSSARFAPPEVAAEPEALPPPQPDPAVPTSPTTPIDRKIIRNATLRFRVRDFRESTARLERIVAQFGGLIASSTESKGDAQIQNDVIIRVPAARLDSFLTVILRESIYTETKSLTAEDVTKRYVDTEARIRSKKATEEKYLQLLKQARSVKDVLEIEQQLAQMREEIEAQEAVFRELKNDIAQSTVTLTYYEQTAASLNPEEPVYTRVWANFTDGLDLLANAFIGFFYVLPLLAVLAGLVWLVVRWRRGRRA
jgi:hypothetical protein